MQKTTGHRRGIVSSSILRGCLAGAILLAASIAVGQTLVPSASRSGPAPVLALVRDSVTRDAGDYYLYGGQQTRLLQSTEEWVLAGATDVEGAVRRARSRAAAPIDVLFERAEFAVLRGSDAARQALRAEGDGRILPVFVDPGTGLRAVALNEALVCLARDASIDDVRPALDQLGAHDVVEIARDTHVYYRVTLHRWGAELLAAANEIASLPGVQWAEPNLFQQIVRSAIPNDPLFTKQQWLHSTGQNGAKVDADLDAPEAWDLTTGSSAIIIAVIDDGVDLLHPDLTIAPGGYDFRDNDSDPSPATSFDNHGTAVAGVAAARWNNSIGGAGVAPGCNILPIKISKGDNDFASSQSIGDAIRYAADRADVLNNSWGGPFPASFIETAINYAVTNGRGGRGCVVLAASGNSATKWVSIPLSLRGLTPGTYAFRFRYAKDVSDSVGRDAVWLDNVGLIEGDGYTFRWREDFEGSFPPAGWQLAKSSTASHWTTTTSDVYTGTAGSRSARTGSVPDNGFCSLTTPLQTIAGTETITFQMMLETEVDFDELHFELLNSAGTVLSSLQFSGITPTDWQLCGNGCIELGAPFDIPVMYPARYANCLAVGASTDWDYRAPYSQYGPELDFLAPSNGGWNSVVTTDRRGSVGYSSGDYTMDFSGTSSATPAAAGVAALMLSRNPNLTATQVRSLMRQSCDKVGPLSYSGGETGAGGRNDEYGYGRVNARRAVEIAGGSAVATPTFNPDGGTHPGTTVQVTVSCATSGAVIYYTTNGADPTQSSATVSSGAQVTVALPGTLKARAWKDGVWSATKSAIYARTSTGITGPVPYTHGGSAGFTDLGIFRLPGIAARASDPQLASAIEPNGLLITGLGVYDARNDIITFLDANLSPSERGQISGIITMYSTPLSSGGEQYIVREFPAKGIHRFREAWRSDLRTRPTTLDGNLTRTINHTIIFNGNDGRGSLARLVARTDPSRRIVDTRLRVVPWVGRLNARVADRNGLFGTNLKATAGISDVFFEALRDEPQGWEMIDSSLAGLNVTNRLLGGEAEFFNPFNKDAAGNVRPIRNQSTLIRLTTIPYNERLNRPGRYSVLYRGEYGLARSRLRQAGWLVAREGELADALRTRQMKRLLFGDSNQGIDGTVFDQNFLCSSPAAITRIFRLRNVNDLTRPN